MLKRQWSSLASAAFRQNFVIQYSFDAFQWLFGISENSQWLCKMQSCLTSSVRPDASPLLWGIVSLHLLPVALTNVILEEAGCKSVFNANLVLSGAFVLAAFAAQVTHSFQAIPGGVRWAKSSVGAVMESCVPWRHLGGAFSGTGPAASPHSLYNPALTGILVCFRPKSCRRSKTMILLMMAKRFILMRITKRCSLRNSKRMLR